MRRSTNEKGSWPGVEKEKTEVHTRGVGPRITLLQDLLSRDKIVGKTKKGDAKKGR